MIYRVIGRQQRQDRHTMTHELKRDVKKQIDRYKLHTETFRVKIQPDNPKNAELELIVKYFSTQSRFHSTTLLLILAHEKKTPYDKLIELRKETMMSLMEQMTGLVEMGLMGEGEYLKNCKTFKEDVELLAM